MNAMGDLLCLCQSYRGNVNPRLLQSEILTSSCVDHIGCMNLCPQTNMSVVLWLKVLKILPFLFPYSFQSSAPTLSLPERPVSTQPFLECWPMLESWILLPRLLASRLCLLLEAIKSQVAHRSILSHQRLLLLPWH
jgi:hypothetical protein